MPEAILVTHPFLGRTSIPPRQLFTLALITTRITKRVPCLTYRIRLFPKPNPSESNQLHIHLQFSRPHNQCNSNQHRFISSSSKGAEQLQHITNTIPITNPLKRDKANKLNTTQLNPIQTTVWTGDQDHLLKCNYLKQFADELLVKIWIAER